MKCFLESRREKGEKREAKTEGPVWAVSDHSERSSPTQRNFPQHQGQREIKTLLWYEVCGLQTSHGWVTIKPWPPLFPQALGRMRHQRHVYKVLREAQAWGAGPSLRTRRPPWPCPCEVTMLFQVVNESCQTKSHFKSTLCKSPCYSTFHLLIMLWIRDQSGRNLRVLEINGFCGYLNPQSPLECNSLGQTSFPDSLPPPPITQRSGITKQTCIM